MKLPKDTEVFPCEMCGAMFTDKEMLAKHKIGCEELTHRCTTCGGKGYIMDMDTYDFRERRTCPKCLGTGKS